MEAALAISPTFHFGLCILGCLFFLFQFLREKKPYQLIMAIAMPVSLAIYLQPESHTLYYAIGIFEIAAFALMILSSIFCSIRNRKKEKTVGKTV